VFPHDRTAANPIESYTGDVLCYAITDNIRPGDDIGQRCEQLRKNAQRWAEARLDYVQLREKEMNAGDLLAAAGALIDVLRKFGGRTQVLINGRADVALVSGADGVHLTSHKDELTPTQVRRLFAKAGGLAPLISVSCHSVEDVLRARSENADLILFGPVFEKRVAGKIVVPGAGLETVRKAVATAEGIPLLALGGVTQSNGERCIAAGAAGIAAIRLFADRPVDA
jgi:thiamine-phosphate pyrophosphorylase